MLGVSGELREEVLRAGAGDGAEVGDQVLLVHADARVADGQGFLLFVQLQIDARSERQLPIGIVGKRQVAEFIQRVRRVGDELAQEDLRMRIEGVNDQMQQLIDFSLKLAFRHRCSPNVFMLLNYPNCPAPDSRRRGPIRTSPRPFRLGTEARPPTADWTCEAYRRGAFLYTSGTHLSLVGALWRLRDRRTADRRGRERGFMATIGIRRFTLVLLAGCLYFLQSPTVLTAERPIDPPPPAPASHAEPGPPSSPQEAAPQPAPVAAPASVTVTPQTPKETPPKEAAPKETSKDQPWQILEAACKSTNATQRATATRVLGLLPENVRATEMAEQALSDSNADVRASGANALGAMHARKSIPLLKKTLDDKDPTVVLAAAHSLYQMHNNSAYEVYYAILTGQRKGNRGLIASQLATISDPKKVAELGFEEGIGFLPFAGIGWRAIKEIRTNDGSSVRAASAKFLADDPDPATTRVLVEAVGDNNWLVRTAALEALAKRGDPSALDTVQQSMSDDKDTVRYTAAAATLRLKSVRKTHHVGSRKP